MSITIDITKDLRYKKGIEIGEERGIRVGEERGIRVGEERGIRVGEERGEKRGMLEGQILLLQELKKINDYDEEGLHNMDIEELQEILNKMKKK